jgi:hypothetical protein
MYLAIGLLGTQAKLIDFIWTLDYGEQMRTEAGGSDTIAGEACNRFSVQRFESTWDVWLSDSDPPLLCKLVSHRTDANDRRVQSNEFTWVRTPEFAPGTFSFVPPAGAREVGPSDLK